MLLHIVRVFNGFLQMLNCSLFRLSDVVKGTAKASKSTHVKDKDSGVVCNSPRAASPASPIPKPAAVPEVKAQQQQTPPPPPTQQLQTSHQVPLPVQAQTLAPSCEKEVKDVGTSSDSSLHAVLQTPPSSPDK